MQHNIEIVRDDAYTQLSAQFTDLEQLKRQSDLYWSFVVSSFVHYRDTGDKNAIANVISAARVLSRLKITRRFLDKVVFHAWGKDSTLIGKVTGKELKGKQAAAGMLQDSQLLEMVESVLANADKVKSSKELAAAKAKADNAKAAAELEKAEAEAEVPMPAADAIVLAVTPEEHIAKAVAHLQSVLSDGLMTTDELMGQVYMQLAESLNEAA